MSREIVQLLVYLAALTATTILAMRGELPVAVVAVVIGAAIPGPGSTRISAAPPNGSNGAPPRA